MDFNSFKSAVIAQAEAQGIAEYELYYQASEGTSVSAFKHEIDGFTSANSGGVCFRCIVGGKMGYASTQELSAAQAADIVRRAADNAASLESEEAVFLGEGGQTYEPLELKKTDLPDTAEMIKAALRGQDALYAADPAVIDGCSTRVMSEKSVVAIYNSKGLDLSYENSSAGLMMGAVVTDGKVMENSYERKMGNIGEIDFDELAGKAAEKAKAKLDATVAPTGVWPVVFAPDAMTSFLATFSSAFSSENAQKGLSRLAGKEGDVIAAPIVTLVDDPFYKDSPMPINFDDEGSPAKCKKVIENGVLNTLLYNLKTAAVAGKTTTGNASKSGYNAPVGISPFTMYIVPGDVSEEELLKMAGNGVYINSLGGTHAGANPISGDFSLQSAGFLIENGVKTAAVKSFTVAGNFFDMLKKITAIGNNIEEPSSRGTAGFASPSVLVENLSIAGK